MKKIISFVLALAILLSLTAFAVEYGAEIKNAPKKSYSQKFTDVPTDHWAFNYIGEMIERKVFAGYPDGKFRPSNTITRAEFAKIMIKAANISIMLDDNVYYADVPYDHWARPFVNNAIDYLTGYIVNNRVEFRPDAAALREDIAIALVKLKGYSTASADVSLLSSMFNDYESISESAKKYVAVAVERGLISGYEDETFRAQQSITRAEASVLLWRAYQYGSDNKVVAETPIATIEPTKIPKPIQTVAPTPTATPTPEPVLTPSPAPTPTPKAYSVDTITNANISDVWNLMTTDKNNDIVYLDEDLNKIFKLDTTTNSKIEILDLSVLQYSEAGSNEVYKKYIAKQIYYDKLSEKIYLNGWFDVVNNGLDDKGAEKEILYEISNGLQISNVIIKGAIKTILSDGTYISFHTYYDDGMTQRIHKLTFSGEKELDLGWWNEYNNSKGMPTHISIFNQKSNDLLYLERDSLSKYNFSTNDWETIQDDFSASAAGLYDDKFYVLENESGNVFTIDASGNFKKLFNIKTDTEVVDMKAIPYFRNDRLFVTSDENIIFYNESSKSIRITRKNN